MRNLVSTERVVGPIDPLRVAHQVLAAGSRWVQLNHAAKLLEKTERTVLSQLTNQVRAADSNLSRREAEDLARASPEFENHVFAMLEARREADLARVTWLAAQAQIDAMRTAEATRRAEIHAFGGGR